MSTYWKESTNEISSEEWIGPLRKPAWMSSNIVDIWGGGIGGVRGLWRESRASEDEKKRHETPGIMFMKTQFREFFLVYITPISTANVNCARGNILLRLTAQSNMAPGGEFVWRLGRHLRWNKEQERPHVSPEKKESAWNQEISWAPWMGQGLLEQQCKAQICLN